MFRPPINRKKVNDFLNTDVSRVVTYLTKRPSELILASRLDLTHEALTSITHFNGPLANRNIVAANEDRAYIITDGRFVMSDMETVCNRILENNMVIFESSHIQGLLRRSKLYSTTDSLRRIKAIIQSKGVYGQVIREETIPSKRKYVPPHVRNMVASSQGWKCNCCGDTFGTVWHNDHVVPIAEGGTDAVENFQALCVECHTNKTARENQMRRKSDDSDRIVIPSIKTTRSTEYSSPSHSGQLKVVDHKDCLDLKVMRSRARFQFRNAYHI